MKTLFSKRNYILFAWTSFFLLRFSFLFFYHFKITIFISPSKHENIFLNKFTKTRILKWLFPKLLFLPKHQNPFQNFLQNSIISNCFSIKLPQEYLPYQCESRSRSRKSFHKPTWPSENLSLSDVPANVITKFTLDVTDYYESFNLTPVKFFIKSFSHVSFIFDLASSPVSRKLIQRDNHSRLQQ